MHKKCTKPILAGILCLLISPQGHTHKAAHGDEWRFGVMRHDTKINEGGLERSFAISAERLWKVEDNKVLKSLWDPRPHAGLNVNTDRRTSSAYIGLTWTVPSTQGFFAELSLGGAVHDGKLHRPSRHRKAQGSRVLFRETVGIGFECPNHETIMIYGEHQSNCKLASPNPGITSVGIRFGIPLNLSTR